MGIASDISALKTKSDTLTDNKVSRFAYTETAYANDDADGVTVYDIENAQNIPVGTPSVMKVNQTVVDKGYRARASSLTRMLLNHFLGRISYNLNKVNDWFNTLLANLYDSLGTADGIATLDSTGRIPYSQSPENTILSMNNTTPDEYGNVEAILGNNVPMTSDMILQTYAYDMLKSVPESVKDDETWYCRMKFIQGHWYNFGSSTAYTKCRRSVTSNIESAYELLFESFTMNTIVDILGDDDHTIVALTAKYSSGNMNSSILVSTDSGETWTEVVASFRSPLPQNRSSVEFDSVLAYGNGVWLINLGGYTSDTSGSQFMISDDAVNWTFVQVGNYTSGMPKCNVYYPYGDCFIVSCGSGDTYKISADVQNPNPTALRASDSSSTARGGMHSVLYDDQALYLMNAGGTYGLYSADHGETFATISVGYGGYLDFRHILYTKAKVYLGDTDIAPSGQPTYDTYLERIGNCFVTYGKVDERTTYLKFVKNLYAGTLETEPFNSALLQYYTKSAQDEITLTTYTTTLQIGQILALNGAIYCFMGNVSGTIGKCFKYSLDSMKVSKQFADSINL